ncbi:MAG: alanine racemase [Gammaproteobacteria bacterium]|nr:alanine racemase [Gammaproteobacteria bacterium]
MTSAVFAVLNLDAVRHNLSIVRCCAPDAKVMAVIKANGYGHGLLRMAEALQQSDAFAVARVDEGIELRKAGFKHRIAILEGFSTAQELDDVLFYQLEVVVHSVTQLVILESKAALGVCVVWLKLDTGMNRLGFKVSEFSSAYQRLRLCALVQQPFNLMTHLANADDVHDDTTFKQISLFNDSVASYSGERSLANSAGVLGWEQSLSEWVRPGLMLYGISPFQNSTGRQLGLRPVMTLHSRLIAIKQIDVGDTVGYGGIWICQKPTMLGVVAIGYGDGYPRHAKVGTPVLVNGKRVKLIGRVSMDMITVDLGSEACAKVGDPVILWGDGLPVEEIAQYADTIPYELVCGVTQRVRLIDFTMNENTK